MSPSNAKKVNQSSEEDQEDDKPQGIVLDEKFIQRSIYISEANVLSRQGDYPPAIELYTKAIDMEPTEALYLCRSRCRTFVGNVKDALVDAEKALELKPDSIKAITCKADVLYSMGNFEDALVWYYRGQHQRPEIEEFKTGIIRCKESILGAINEMTPPELEKIKLNFQVSKTKSNDSQKKKKGGSKSNLLKAPSKSLGSLTQLENVEKNLLEELYPDRQYLKELMNDSSLMNASEGQVGSLVREGMAYLDQRIEFWRGKNPLALHEVTLMDVKKDLKQIPAAS